MEFHPLRTCVVSLLAAAVVACGPDGGSVPESTVEAPTASPSTPTRESWVAEPGGPTLFDHVVGVARDRAASSYRPPAPAVTPVVADLTYGQYRGIRFRREEAVWRGETPFELQLFHPGGGNDTPVRLHLVEDGRVRSLGFRPELFLYGDEVQGMDLGLPPEAGYAGFRVLYPLNESEREDEVVSFLGASYFRLLGPGHVYGLSSRGLAVGVAAPEGEEFPDFTEFWLVRPDSGATELTFFGLLDGPSVTGAYRFRLLPGGATATGSRESPTVMEVEARLFARTRIDRLGVAPLTSMYLHGTFRPGGDDDFRPRVHDSQGLLMRTSEGEWIWRPLSNRTGVRVTSLRDVDPVGFGLVQREREFDAYLDLEARYDRRPSEWVQILDGDWGGGGVELVEIPSPSEFNDNIVAYWRPDRPFEAGEERRFSYRLVTFDDHLPTPGPRTPGLVREDRARVVRTRIGWDALPGQTDPPPRTRRRVVVDFRGGVLSTLPAEVPVEAVASTSAGTIADLLVHHLPGGGRRATFALVPEADRPADIRLFLQVADSAVTETWSYLWENDLER